MARKSTEDLRKYWQEIATKAGIAPETISAMDAALGDDSVAKAFKQAFVPVPDHHSTVDEIKNEYHGYKAQLDDWYKNQAMPAYQTNLSGIERLRQYEAAYGELDPGATTRSGALDLGFNSKAELDKYLEDRFKAQQAGFVGIAKAIPKMTVDYYNRFKKVLDPDEVEKIAVKEGLPPDLAYERFIAPEVEAQQKADFEAKLKEAEDRGFQKAATKYHLPVESTPRESSPFWADHLKDTSKPLSEAEQDRASRQSFLDGWNGYAEQIANKNRPS